MSLKLTKESLILVLEVHAPKSLTEAYRLLNGEGKLSGSTAKKMRELVPDIDEWIDKNKAKANADRAEGQAQENKTTLPTSGESRKPAKKVAKAVIKSKVLRHPKNPFRPGGYATLVDLIANAGAKGIGREDLLSAYCKASGKDLTHAKYDLAVINSAREDSDKRHRSCADGFTILKDGDNYRIRFA